MDALTKKTSPLVNVISPLEFTPNRRGTWHWRPVRTRTGIDFVPDSTPVPTASNPIHTVTIRVHPVPTDAPDPLNSKIRIEYLGENSETLYAEYADDIIVQASRLSHPTAGSPPESAHAFAA